MQFNLLLLSFAFLFSGISSLEARAVQDTVPQRATRDSTTARAHFSGLITATNNGISLIPSFTLGRPALLFDLSFGEGRWSFDPMLRFAMDGKPWVFVLWGRYRLFDAPKFKMSVGAHPAFVFRELSLPNNGSTKGYLTTQRYFAWEATPTFYPSPNIGLGIHYLGSHGLTEDLVQYTTFLAAKATFAHIPMGKKYYLSFGPQTFYLKMDKNDGIYASTFLGLYKTAFPVSVSTILSQKINSEIAGDRFIWGLQLVYSFNNQYHKPIPPAPLPF